MSGEKHEETKKSKEQQVPKGYYLAQVPTGYGIVLMKDGEQISLEEQVVKNANALEKAGLLKD